MRGSTRVVLVALAAGTLGVVAALAVRGPGPLLATEAGQRAVQGVLSATAPEAPEGVIVAERGDIVPPMKSSTRWPLAVHCSASACAR